MFGNFTQWAMGVSNKIDFDGAVVSSVQSEKRFCGLVNLQALQSWLIGCKIPTINTLWIIHQSKM